jgi:small GTP-binding protein
MSGARPVVGHTRSGPERSSGVDHRRSHRLPEEKARGITIDLGFAFLEEPDGLTIEIVDVPGHERFVKNMLAGIGGIDLAMLVIAADEGVMPQTREHFAICSLLHIRGGLVALTKTDMVEPDWLELVREDVAGLVRGTFLEGGPIVPVSAKTGAGVADLRAALRDLAQRVAPRGPISCHDCRSTGSSPSRASARSSPARSWPDGCASTTGSRSFPAACRPRCGDSRPTASR